VNSRGREFYENQIAVIPPMCGPPWRICNTDHCLWTRAAVWSIVR